MEHNNARVAVITGAVGGMGRAAARLLGRRYRLVLTDFDPVTLETFGQSLADEGYDIAGSLAADLTQPDQAASLARLSANAGAFGTLVHTAGLSPALAGWEPILRVNLVSAAQLAEAFAPLLIPGAVAVMIASIAAHRAPALPEIDALLDAPLADDFCARLGPLLQAMGDPGNPYGVSGPAYGFSKRGVIRLCEALAPAWGRLGARIVSVSPGTIYTPMGRREAEVNPAAAAVQAATPLQRWGTVMDIASAIDFLVSDHASFITGCDLRVDGGVVPGLAGPTF